MKVTKTVVFLAIALGPMIWPVQIIKASSENTAGRPSGENQKKSQVDHDGSLADLASGQIVWQTELSESAPLSTCFTYHGRLVDGGRVADGYYDFRFRLLDEPNDIYGYQIGEDVKIADVEVIEGRFAVELDFGTDILDVNSAWLEVGMQSDELGNTEEYTTLEPLSVVALGTANYIAKYTGASTFGNSVMYESDDMIGLGTTTPAAEFHIRDGDTPTVRLEQDDSGGWTPQTWDMAGNETNFFIRDVTNGSILPFRIGPGAAGSTLCLRQSGVGIGTWSPAVNLHVQDSSGAKLLVESTGSNDFALIQSDAGDYIWSSGVHRYGNGDSWGVYEDTTSSKTRLLIKTGGRVGIGTRNPRSKLHVEESSGAKFILRSNSTSGYSLAENDAKGYVWSSGVHRSANGDSWGVYEDGTSSKTRLLVKSGGNVGIGTPTPQGRLDVNGSIYQRGSQLHADYVFETGYQLESIEEHSDFMWSNKHLPAIPKAKHDENGQEILEVGAHRKGVVEELEKAHIYIDQLHKRINELEQQKQTIDSRLAVMEAAYVKLGLGQEASIP
jgi:hypothetical protein